MRKLLNPYHQPPQDMTAHQVWVLIIAHNQLIDEVEALKKRSKNPTVQELLEKGDKAIREKGLDALTFDDGPADDKPEYKHGKGIAKDPIVVKEHSFVASDEIHVEKPYKVKEVEVDEVRDSNTSFVLDDKPVDNPVGKLQQRVSDFVGYDNDYDTHRTVTLRIPELKELRDRIEEILDDADVWSRFMDEDPVLEADKVAEKIIQALDEVEGESNE